MLEGEDFGLAAGPVEEDETADAVNDETFGDIGPLSDDWEQLHERESQQLEVELLQVARSPHAAFPAVTEEVVEERILFNHKTTRLPKDPFGSPCWQSPPPESTTPLARQGPPSRRLSSESFPSSSPKSNADVPQPSFTPDKISLLSLVAPEGYHNDENATRTSAGVDSSGISEMSETRKIRGVMTLEELQAKIMSQAAKQDDLQTGKLDALTQSFSQQNFGDVSREQHAPHGQPFRAHSFSGLPPALSSSPPQNGPGPSIAAGQMPPQWPHMSPGQMPPGQMLPGQMPPGQMPPSQYPPGQYPQPYQHPMHVQMQMQMQMQMHPPMPHPQMHGMPDHQGFPGQLPMNRQMPMPMGMPMQAPMPYPPMHPQMNPHMHPQMGPPFGQGQRPGPYAPMGYPMGPAFPPGQNRPGPNLTMQRRHSGPDMDRRPSWSGSNSGYGHDDDEGYTPIGNSFLTREELDGIVRQQYTQMHSMNPYMDDFYYINFAASKSEVGRSMIKQVPVPSLCLPAGKDKDHLHQHHGAVSAMWSTVLGRTTKADIRTPRVLLQLENPNAQSSTQSSPTQQLPTTPSPQGSPPPSVASSMPVLVQKLSKGEDEGRGRLHSRNAVRLDIENAFVVMLEMADLDRNLASTPPPFQGNALEQRRECIEKLVRILGVYQPPPGWQQPQPIKIAPNGNITVSPCCDADDVLLIMLRLVKGRKLLTRVLRSLTADQCLHILYAVLRNAYPTIVALYEDFSQDDKTVVKFIQAIAELICRQSLLELSEALHILLVALPIPSLLSAFLSIEGGVVVLDALLHTGQLLTRKELGPSFHNSNGVLSSAARASTSPHVSRWFHECQNLANQILGTPSRPPIPLQHLFAIPSHHLACHYISLLAIVATSQQRRLLLSSLSDFDEAAVQPLVQSLLAFEKEMGSSP